MLYAKVLSCGAQDFHHASVEYRMYSADKIEFYNDSEGKPFMVVSIYKQEDFTVMEHVALYGDVFVMSESGKTLSRFAPGLVFLGRDAEGWKGDARVQ